MDDFVSTSGADQGQIDRRRASAIRDFADDLDRELRELEFETNRELRYAIDDVAGDDPRDPACVMYEAEGAVRRIVEEHGWVLRRALRAFLKAIAP